MSLSVALADANILLPRTLRDYVVYSAKVGAFDVHWSQSILDEVSRNLIKIFGLSTQDTDELEIRLGHYLPQDLVEIRPRDLKAAEAVTMDAKDRHVVAAALSAKASVLVTDNVKHFPKEWLADRGIELLSAAGLLVRLATDHPEELKKAHAMTVAPSPLRWRHEGSHRSPATGGSDPGIRASQDFVPAPGACVQARRKR